jgi:hypothetical protein
MPSARELLEQADALMRRNRGRETLSPAMGPRTMGPSLMRRPPVAPGDFPVLSDPMPPPAERPRADAVPAPPAAPARGEAAPAHDVRGAPPPAHADTPMPQERPMPGPRVYATPEPPVAETRVEPTLSAPLAPSRETTAEAAWPGPAPAPEPHAYADVPVLTDAIAEIDAALIAAAEEGEPSIWNDEAMRGDDSVLGPAPKSIAAIPHSPAVAESPARGAGASAEADAARVAKATDELIDEVRMQVLQRIDMFTDTGLREQLGERLQPIVDRASAELVATINQHVGELLRSFVAEAIERELERLRTGLH